MKSLKSKFLEKTNFGGKWNDATQKTLESFLLDQKGLYNNSTYSQTSI